MASASARPIPSKKFVNGLRRCAIMFFSVLVVDRLADEHDHTLVDKGLSSIAPSLPHR